MGIYKPYKKITEENVKPPLKIGAMKLEIFGG